MTRRLVLALCLGAPAVTGAQVSTRIDSSWFTGLRWREIGPFRGGRVDAVVGDPRQPLVFYFGATGGGVWKTTDGGLSWRPLGDGQLSAGSIGAVAVAEADPNVVYVGTGEQTLRGNVSPGDGLFRSTDGGKTWARAGLRDAGQIARIVVHPGNADLVYAAAFGHVFGPNPMRGVYRSADGGKTWQRVLARNDSTRRCGRRSARPGTSPPAARARGSSSPPTAATPGPS